MTVSPRRASRWPVLWLVTLVVVLLRAGGPVAGQDGLPVVAAVLPSSRSAMVGEPITAFVAVVNFGSDTLHGVGVFLRTPIPARMRYQTTDRATNTVTGTPDTPVDLPAGASQTFVITLTPTAPFAPTILEFGFAEGESGRIPTIVGVNTLLLSASTQATPDIVAVAVTPTADGILSASISGAVAMARATVPGGGATRLRHRGAFAVAVVNAGAARDRITVEARASGDATIDLTVRETDPTTGAVIGGSTKVLEAGQTATFAVILEAQDPVAFDPARRRIFVEFRDSGGVVRGSTSVAVSTRRGELIARGADLFFNEKFDGNGRTCATCHPADNNFTLDPAFIARLRPDDALFVSETAPALATLENARLLREFALVVENVDGFDRPGVFRGVPHTLALATSVQSFGGPRTGWSGDGAPGDGTLRSFATGAVTQHFTRTLNRVPGVDFRLPDATELEALEAFQLALGRQSDLSLPLPLKSVAARNGQAIFLDNDVGRCNRCHVNAGATANFGAGSLGNTDFDTGVENFPPEPPRPSDQLIPPDGGAGKNPRAVPAGGFGNGQFNTPPLVEAADTPPFFHNNSVQTIEDAVAFYNSLEFNTSLGAASVGGPITLTPEQVIEVAAFLRVINALENIRSAAEMVEESSLLTDEPEIRAQLLALAAKDLGDAIGVLAGGALHPEAVAVLAEAQAAASRHETETVRARIRDATALLLEVPLVSLSLSHTAVQPGRTLTVGLEVSHGDHLPPAELYVGAILPGGQLLVLLSSAGTVAGAVTLQAPAGATPTLAVAPGFALNEPKFAAFTFPADGIPFGTYAVFAALLRQVALADNHLDADDLLALAVRSFVFEP